MLGPVSPCNVALLGATSHPNFCEQITALMQLTLTRSHHCPIRFLNWGRRPRPKVARGAPGPGHGEAKRREEKRREDGRVKHPLQMTHSAGLPEKLERELELAGGGGGAGDGTGGGTRRV